MIFRGTPVVRVQAGSGTQYERSQTMLKEHQSALETLAQQLLKQETVDGSMVKLALGNISVPADKQKSKN